MPFMQRQITEKIDWLSIDGDNGTELVPLFDVFNPGIERVQAEIGRMNDSGDFSQIGEYYESGAEHIQTVEIVTGHGCRLSAPGYMDCTSWGVFPTVEACKEYLDETYPEEDETK